VPDTTNADSPSAEYDTATFAAVVVNVEAPGLRQPFTYRVPEHLAEQITPGACVVVPFGTSQAIGYIVTLTERPPERLEAVTIKDIAARVTGDGASLPNAVLQTARWMAQTYLCDLAQSVRCVIPDAQAAHIVRRYSLADGWQELAEEVKTASHRQVIELLAAHPDRGLTEDELSKALERARVSSPIQLLRKRGILTDQWQVEPPRTGARKVKAVRLIPNWDDAEVAAATREEKAPAQARLLRALIASGGGPLPTAEITVAADSSPSALKKLEADGLVAIETLILRRRPFKFVAGAAVPPMPSGEQEAAVAEIKKRLDTREANVALLYGVTGSGKTEVYLRAIAEIRRRRRTALVLVPEIALTAQVVDNFRARIGDRVAVLHSALSDGERRDEWQRIGRGEADVVVGARSAAFAPLDNVGLIVVDEEHEGSYKQDQPAPRYHARDVAIARARATGATVLLGSATPAVESFYKAEAGEWGFLPLRERALSRPLPSVDVVDLREGYKKGSPQGIFSPALQEAIADRLAKQEQIILFLNRRGWAMFLLCRDCGYTTRCPHCDVSLTFHARSARLACHHCGYERAAPTVCPTCAGTRIRPFGIGTEKVEAEVRMLFENARVLRMDRDTTVKKDAHMKMLRAFRGGEADILIGTQMVAKGLDFAGVTLVGVISADTALNLPDFRASERAFQLLTQVSGRAGRGRKPGHVIVQTFNPEHESVAAAAEHDYETFYRQEIVNRRELAYPPFTRLANIVSQDEDVREAESRLRILASYLGGRRSLLDGPKIGGDDDLTVLGPAPCPLGRLRNRYRWHLLLKAADRDTLRTRIRAAMTQLTASERVGITVDIDPMSLL
jgi:primosomal protein N' (replication factor Y)